MPFQKMSTNEVLGDTAAHFFKSGNTLRADNFDELIKISELLPTDRKVEYDIWYDKNDEKTVHGYVYTDMANQFLYTACLPVRTYQTMVEAAQSEITDEGEMLYEKISVQ